MREPVHYDIIGDIHGRFDKLAGLLQRMGYEREGAGFKPPAGRVALFLGDLIDPKEGHVLPGGVRATLRAVKAMMDAGHALCLMGNHELNAVYYHSKGPDGRWLRHHGSRNRRMHAGTLADFPDHRDPAGEWMSVWMPWLKKLPLWLDLGGIRAVHATWHEESIALLTGRDLADVDFFLAASDERTPEGNAVEILLKGLLAGLPEGVFFLDGAGIQRGRFRVCWWLFPEKGMPCGSLVFPANADIPDHPVSDDAIAGIPSYPLAAPPVFFGHYSKPSDSLLHPERHNVACLDHSAAKGGPLIAYRWRGERELDPAHYVRHG
ncbi:hypothetical protein JIN84_06000 [Luteolibacter yonseiensis]|uniref:Calcineurin-like phosphoesterase domain-containing protein n=1 Tax=Luteolibacter yonseiensis TaxID=1144680 RepID=A0A934R4K6_9BACT|nr:metallophosphoesterase [Luteolibacter yonseiensis]MBK1815155.1 hypothetical protein [Luteolibacter yonseiensis]